MKRSMALLLVAMFSMSFLSACNTVAGAGKDMQGAGEKVEDKAQDCKDGKCWCVARDASERWVVRGAGAIRPLVFPGSSCFAAAVCVHSPTSNVG